MPASILEEAKSRKTVVVAEAWGKNNGKGKAKEVIVQSDYIDRPITRAQLPGRVRSQLYFRLDLQCGFRPGCDPGDPCQPLMIPYSHDFPWHVQIGPPKVPSEVILGKIDPISGLFLGSN